jgi:glyoxylase-like metal-dependent hydrolase (beta-lactamase superfamily II)
MRNAAAALLALSVGAAPSLAQQPPLVLTRHQITERIDVFSGFTNGNVLAVRADTGTLLVDAQSARRVVLLDSALQALGARAVKLVINTHYHGDHIEGNAHFGRRGARLLAQRNLPLQAVKDTTITSWDNWHRTAAAPEAVPAFTFSDSTVLQFGDQEVRVYHAPNAHTDGDAVIWLPRANIIHLGDIFELAAPPFIDWWAGGSLAGMIAQIDRFLPRIDERTRVVPGHGPVADRATLLRYRAMLVTLQQRVQAAVDAGKSIDVLVAEQPAAEFDTQLGGARFSERLTRLLYAGLARRPTGGLDR